MRIPWPGVVWGQLHRVIPSAHWVGVYTDYARALAGYVPRRWAWLHRLLPEHIGCRLRFPSDAGSWYTWYIVWPSGWCIAYLSWRQCWSRRSVLIIGPALHERRIPMSRQH